MRAAAGPAANSPPAKLAIALESAGCRKPADAANSVPMGADGKPIPVSPGFLIGKRIQIIGSTQKAPSMGTRALVGSKSIGARTVRCPLSPLVRNKPIARTRRELAI